MSVPDFDKAEYVEPAVIDGETGFVVDSPRARIAAFPLALAYGVGAAIVGAVGYAVIGLSGFMVSIVTIAIGWLVARAMMTASGGMGGQQYQIAAVVLTYLSASFGGVLDVLYYAHKQGIDISRVPAIFLLKYTFLGPILRITDSPGWGLLGLLILFYGLRTAWQMAAGTPGFGQAGGARMTIMGVRR